MEWKGRHQNIWISIFNHETTWMQLPTLIYILCVSVCVFPAQLFSKPRKTILFVSFFLYLSQYMFHFTPKSTLLQATLTTMQYKHNHSTTFTYFLLDIRFLIPQQWLFCSRTVQKLSVLFIVFYTLFTVFIDDTLEKCTLYSSIFRQSNSMSSFWSDYSSATMNKTKLEDVL